MAMSYETFKHKGETWTRHFASPADKAFIMGVLARDPQDSEAMLKARKEVEQAWQRAMYKIAERAALTKGSNMRR